MKNTIVWVLSALIALLFLGVGSAKLFGGATMVQQFHAFGYPGWFLYVTGILEVLGAVLLLIPRLATLGAVLLACVMVGALVTLLTHGMVAMVALPLILLALLVWIAQHRRSALTLSTHN